MSAPDSELQASPVGASEPEQSDNVRDIYRLAWMASSLEFAARELCHAANIDPNDGRAVLNAEANRAVLETESQLSRGVEKSEP